jgi:hybrid cluster-associated redox disulfide protein
MENLIPYIISGISFILAAYSVIRTRKLKEEVQRARDEADALRRHVGYSLDQLKTDIIAGLKTEMRRQSGAPYFHKDMTIGEALRLHPLAQTVMAGFHLGGCSSCDIKEDHILGVAAKDYGIDLDALLEALNGLLDGTTVLPSEEIHQIKLVDMLNRRD